MKKKINPLPGNAKFSFLSNRSKNELKKGSLLRLQIKLAKIPTIINKKTVNGLNNSKYISNTVNNPENKCNNCLKYSFCVNTIAR